MVPEGNGNRRALHVFFGGFMVVLWCGFGRERSTLPALPLKHNRVVVASQKKFSTAVRSILPPEIVRVLAERRFSSGILVF